MSEKNELFNALVDAIKEHGKNMEIGLVRAVLQEVDSAISMRLGRLPLKSIASQLKKRDYPTDARASVGQDKNQ